MPGEWEELWVDGTSSSQLIYSETISYLIGPSCISESCTMPVGCYKWAPGDTLILEY